MSSGAWLSVGLPKVDEAERRIVILVVAKLAEDALLTSSVPPGDPVKVVQRSREDYRL